MCEKKPYCNRKIDTCLEKTIRRINTYSHFKTLACCCGHDKYPPTIIIKNKKTRKIFELFSKSPLKPRKRNRFYKKDKEGYYFIPEIIKRYEYCEFIDKCSRFDKKFRDEFCFNEFIEVCSTRNALLLIKKIKAKMKEETHD